MASFLILIVVPILVNIISGVLVKLFDRWLSDHDNKGS
ncbi:type I toxin-antitoxin system Fst family toxin [Lactobacillus sp. DCY120]|uniref:Type I toxin-antitoxin system Fst family toxin n=1 Tax=Bombilactobacillus apium TaxID=2675299 RepID=A0A850R0Z7_9LACO|nr:type I toxin-antitoxin system Fst family toxin [Bombilactobacillus apium]NVY96593.1 type I toxin-antitoxin system Fst family toxin [Bombilactobacillus apium]